MDILPPRPLRLAEKALAARRGKARLLAALAALVGAGFCAGCVWMGSQAWRERGVWERGDRGLLLSVQGKVTTGSHAFVDLFYDYELEVVFADAQGTRHSAKVEFGTMWKPVDTGRPASLRFLREDLEHPVLSYSIDAGFARWALPVGLGLFGILMLSGAALIPRRQSQREQQLREAAEDGEEALYPLLSVTRYKQLWTVRYEPAPGVKAAATGPDEPLVAVRDGRQHVVALRSASRAAAPVLIPADLALFELDPAARAAILEKLRG